MSKQETPLVVRKPDEIRSATDPWRAAGDRLALVPTMGGLHNAHISLVTLAKSLAERTLVSIFVSPKQFGPGEDFEKYPRDEAADLALLGAAGADLVYMPSEATMFPPDFASDLHAGPLAEVLCGRSRPGHFDGVLTAVAELFRQTKPDLAVFGEKDFQQLRIIRDLVESQNLPVEIVAAPLKRDPDGLATSSRNAYLNDEERRQTLNIAATLTVLAVQAAAGEPLRSLEDAGAVKLGAAGLDLEYLEFRHEDNLELAEDLLRPVRLFAAVRVGKTRLIDNMAVVA